jgi:hypothetical protein
MRKKKKFKAKRMNFKVLGLAFLLGALLLWWQGRGRSQAEPLGKTLEETKVVIDETDATLQKLLLGELPSEHKESILLEERATLQEPAIPEASVLALARLQIVDHILKKHAHLKSDALLFFNQCVEADGVAMEIRLYCYDKLLELDHTEHFLAAVKVPETIKRLATQHQSFKP